MNGPFCFLKKERMRFVMIFCALAISMMANAQVSSDIFITDNKGTPIKAGAYSEIVGSAYFPEEFVKGIGFLKSGTKTDAISMRINCLTNEIHYMNSDDKEWIFPRGQFVRVEMRKGLDTWIVVSGLPKVDNLTESTLFFVVYEGKISLLTYRWKRINETTEFNSGVVKKKFETIEDQYLYDGTKMVKVTKDSNQLLELFQSKKDQVAQFVKANKLKLKRKDDLIKLLEYYNSI